MCSEAENREPDAVERGQSGALCCNMSGYTQHQTGNIEDGTSGGIPSFETVLQLFHKKIYNFAYWMLGDLDEAADLTQETFVKAYTAYPRFRGTPKAIYPWLCQITTNNCRNRFREIARKSQHEALSLDEPIEIEGTGTGFEVGDDSADPAGVFERREMEAKIYEAIQSLPPEFRLVVILRDMQGLSYKEVAAATGLTVETVKARLFRGRGILRRKLSPYISG